MIFETQLKTCFSQKGRSLKNSTAFLFFRDIYSSFSGTETTIKRRLRMTTGIMFFGFLGVMAFAAIGVIKIGDLVLTVIEKVKNRTE